MILLILLQHIIYTIEPHYGEQHKISLHPEQKKWKAPKGPKPIHHKNKNLIGLGRTIANQRSKENSIQYLPDGEMRFTTDKRRLIKLN